MLKRKHKKISSEGPLPRASQNRALRLQKQQLEGSFEQGKKSLFRALKVARGFERQKLGRRQKTAKIEKAEIDTARLESEVAALKV